MPSQVVSDPAYYTAEMSYAEWKREPTTTQVLFGLQLPYRPPRSLIGQFLWRRRVWVEVTFALSMLEPWEKFLVMIVMYLTLGLLLTGMYLYLPHHLAFLTARASYYLFGRDASGDLPDSLSRLKAVASWGLNTSITSIANVGSFGASLAGWGAPRRSYEHACAGCLLGPGCFGGVRRAQYVMLCSP
ncbi:hypothetical protein C8T65DRAFT_612780 [Cerioporus squamosus]|nr:hypothetical protein C8T65DRAFT_612780 [Cerioporus squamosus]